MVILPDACGLSGLSGFRRNAEAIGEIAALNANYGTLCAPRQELWNNYKLALDQLTPLDKFEVSTV